MTTAFHSLQPPNRSPQPHTVKVNQPQNETPQQQPTFPWLLDLANLNNMLGGLLRGNKPNKVDVKKSMDTQQKNGQQQQPTSASSSAASAAGGVRSAKAERREGFVVNERGMVMEIVHNIESTLDDEREHEVDEEDDFDPDSRERLEYFIDKNDEETVRVEWTAKAQVGTSRPCVSLSVFVRLRW